MANQSDQTPADAMRKQTLGLLVKIGAAVAILWVIYLCAAVMGVDPVHGFRKPEGNSVTLYFWMSLVVTIGAIPFAGWKMWELRRLGERGTATIARPVKIGAAGSGGLRTVEFVYAAGNAQHRMRVDVPASFVEHYTKATQLPALYDPQQPGRCRMLQLSATAGEPRPPSIGIGNAILGGVMGASSEITEKVMIVLIVAAAVGGVFGITRLFTDAEFIHSYGLSLLLAGLALGGLGLAGLTMWRNQRLQLTTSPRMHLLIVAVLAAGAAYWAWDTHSTLWYEAEHKRQMDAQDAERREQAEKARAGIESLQKLNAARQQRDGASP